MSLIQLQQTSRLSLVSQQTCQELWSNRRSQELGDTTNRPSGAAVEPRSEINKDQVVTINNRGEDK